MSLLSRLVHLHLLQVPDFVLSSEFIILGTFLIGKSLKLLRDDFGNIPKARVGVCNLHGSTMRVRVDEEGTLIAFGGVGVLLLLLAVLVLLGPG